MAAKQIAKWNGTQWSELGGGIGTPPDEGVRALFDDGTGEALYAGGAFSFAGGVAANSIAKWNGTQWSPLGSGVNNIVRALTVFDDGTGPALYAGGSFTTAGGVAALSIAKWDGTQWSALGSGLANVFALAVDDAVIPPALYAGGAFHTFFGAPGNNIARWRCTVP